MDTLQFALTIIIVSVLFLAFALTLIALILGNPTTQANLIKLVLTLSKRVFSLIEK